jgi:hypothetical protein
VCVCVATDAVADTDAAAAADADADADADETQTQTQRGGRLLAWEARALFVMEGFMPRRSVSLGAFGWYSHTWLTEPTPRLYRRRVITVGDSGRSFRINLQGRSRGPKPHPC